MYNYMWNQNWSGGPWGSGMMNWGGSGFNLFGGMMFGGLMLVLVIWTVYWKYHALWHAAKQDEKWWFLAMLLINTLGILEILYLYYFSKQKMKHDEHSLPMVPPQS